MMAITLFQVRKQRHRQDSNVPSHPAGELQRQDSNPGSATLSHQAPLTKSIHCWVLAQKLP